MKEVVIVGAGVVGLVAAREMAARGLDVTVYDQKRRVSDNAEKASGILSKEGLDRIGIEYDVAKVNTLYGAVLHAGKQKLRIKARDVKALVLDRRKLVESCMEEAEKEGAKIILGKKIGKEELLALNDKSRVIVGADGAVSGVASVFGFPKINEFVLTYKKTYNKAHVDDSGVVDLFFYSRANRFFGWSAPYSSSTTELGIGVSSRARTSSTKAFDEFIRLGEVASMIENAKGETGYASMIPLEARKKTVSGNVLLVGDAAGQVKATTGGGIIFGALCAKVAAEAVERHLVRGEPLDIYEREWKRRYGADLKLHRMIHEYYSSLSSRNFESFFRIARVLGAEAFFSKYGDMDRPSTMLKRFFLRSLAGRGEQ